MNPSEQICFPPERLLQFLRDELNETEAPVVQHHLDECGTCRSLLEKTAADRQSWHEASVLLTEDPWRRSVCQSESQVGSTSPSLQIKQVLDLLHPTDDPAMLGRVGGYEVSGVVGSGGMGVVLKAADRSLDRIVAIKVLAPHLASSGAARARFEREAKAAAAVIHPNVIAIHGVATNSELPYLVMPYMRGVTLRTRVDAEGPLPLVDILRIGAQIAAGLAAAHRQGLVHRDIKPANVLLEDGVERVVITDFGLARAVDDASVTRTGVIAGTPQYMSPEQARGDAVDHRADLFSLGSVLYTLCTGRPPFRADTSFGILRRITDKTPHPIRETNPAIPEWLCRLIDKLHAKSADLRYQSAEEVADLLEKCLAHVQTPNTPLPHELKTFPTRSRYKQLLAAIGVVVVLYATVIGPYAYLNQNEKTGSGKEKVGEATDERERAVAQDRKSYGEAPSKALLDSDAATQWNDDFGPSPLEVNRKALQLSGQTEAAFAVGPTGNTKIEEVYSNSENDHETK